MVAVSLLIITGAPSAAVADTAILEPVPDREINLLLDQIFALPMAIDDTALRNAMRDDMIGAEVARLTALLTSRGYLEARIETSGAVTKQDPLRLTPVPGALFTIKDIRINGLPPQFSTARPALAALLSTSKGATARRSVIDDLTRGMLFELRQASYADAALREVAFDLDRQSKTANLILTVDPGLPMRFGTVLFGGSLRVDQTAAQALVPFRSGDTYSIDAIETLTSTLDQTGKFRRIRIDTETAPGVPGVINVSVRLWDQPQLPLEVAQPHILLAAILILVVMQIVRMTSYWSDSRLRLLLIAPAVLMISAAALEVTARLRWFLYQ